MLQKYYKKYYSNFLYTCQVSTRFAHWPRRLAADGDGGPAGIGWRQFLLDNFTQIYYDLGNMTEEDNMELLTNAGCDVIQGYLFAKPMPKEAFEAMPGSTDHLSMNHREQGG